jgi:hypothetical protein
VRTIGAGKTVKPLTASACDTSASLAFATKNTRWAELKSSMCRRRKALAVIGLDTTKHTRIII